MPLFLLYKAFCTKNRRKTGRNGFAKPRPHPRKIALRDVADLLTNGEKCYNMVKTNTKGVLIWNRTTKTDSALLSTLS